MPKTKRIPTNHLSHTEWLALRRNGLGGSEVAALLGLDKYKSKLELYLDKIGEPIFPFKGNKYSYAGQEDEPTVRYRAQYIEIGAPTEVMWENIQKGNKLRNIKKYPYMIFSNKYPHLFADVDGSVREKGSKATGVEEVKCTTSYAARNFKHNLNPSFIAQTQDYLLITGWQYAHITQRIDGVDYETFPFDPIPEIQEEIIEKSTEFWIKILQAREVKKEYNISHYYGVPADHFSAEQRDGVALLQSLEPDLTGSDCETSFLKDFIVPPEDLLVLEGDENMLQSAVNYLNLGEQLDEAKQEYQKAGNTLKLIISGYNEIHFDPEGKSGKVTYKTDKLGRSKLYVAKKLKDYYRDVYAQG